MDGWVEGWTGGWTDGRVGGRMDGWEDGWVNGWTGARTDGRLGGWMDGWVDGCTCGWTHGQLVTSIFSFKFILFETLHRNLNMKVEHWQTLQQVFASFENYIRHFSFRP